MANTQLLSSLLLNISDLLNAQDCSLNPSQEALVLVLNLDIASFSEGRTKAELLDRVKCVSSYLFTLAGNTELGDLLQRKVYQLSIEMYRAGLSS